MPRLSHIGDLHCVRRGWLCTPPFPPSSRMAAPEALLLAPAPPPRGDVGPLVRTRYLGRVGTDPASCGFGWPHHQVRHLPVTLCWCPGRGCGTAWSWQLMGTCGAESEAPL